MREAGGMADAFRDSRGPAGLPLRGDRPLGASRRRSRWDDRPLLGCGLPAGDRPRGASGGSRSSSRRRIGTPDSGAAAARRTTPGSHPEPPLGSWALATRRLSADWEAHGSPRASDPARFAGTCYRAANWQFLRRYPRIRAPQRAVHGTARQPKRLYVYPLRRSAAGSGRRRRRPACARSTTGTAWPRCSPSILALRELSQAELRAIGTPEIAGRSAGLEVDTAGSPNGRGRCGATRCPARDGDRHRRQRTRRQPPRRRYGPHPDEVRRRRRPDRCRSGRRRHPRQHRRRLTATPRTTRPAPDPPESFGAKNGTS